MTTAQVMPTPKTPLIILSMMITEDGFVAGSYGELGWVIWGGEADAAALELLKRADMFAAGHHAFADMAAYWPEVAASGGSSAEEQTYANALCGMPKAIIGRRGTARVWDERATLAPNSLPEGFADLCHLESVLVFGGEQKTGRLPVGIKRRCDVARADRHVEPR